VTTSGTKVAGVTSPYVKTGLSNGTTYYFIVTAVNAVGESAASSSVSAAPATAAGVSSVTPLTASSVAASGASTYPASISDIQSLFSAFANDASATSELTALSTSIQNTFSGSSALQTSYNNFQTEYTNFPSTKTATFNASLQSGALGPDIALNTATANISLNAATFDGLSIATDSSNLKSLSGSILGSFDAGLIPANIPTGPLKDAKIRFNLGADASASTSTPGLFSSSGNTAGNVTVSANYNLSVSIALSMVEASVVNGTVTSSNMGGIIVLAANSQFSNTQTIAVSSTTNLSSSLSQFFPSTAPVSLTITVYDDSGNTKFTQTYSSYTDLINAFTSITTTTSMPSAIKKVISAIATKASHVR
jgi:hypothetical protein